MGNITHAKVSTIPDGTDTDLVRPSDWNADHEVSAPVAGHDVATKEYVDTTNGTLDYGLSFKGEITAVIDTTHFDVASLIGMGTGFFKPFVGSPYEIHVVQADGAAPEGEQTPVVAYTSATGRLQHVAFSVPLAVGDVVLIQHPIIASLGTKATAAATGAVTTTDFLMAYIKQLVTELQVADALLDNIDDAVQHTTHIFPDDTNLTCTFTAHADANTWSAWAEIADSGATTLSSLMAAVAGHISSIVVETVSEPDTIYMVEISYGAGKTKLVTLRFAGGTKFQAPNVQNRMWPLAFPAGETIYYRMKTATAVANTCTVHFRYHLH